MYSGLCLGLPLASKVIAAHSHCSVLSILSVASFGSALSILSFGSVLSIASIGSTMSIASIGSVNSFVSIGSYGCSFTYFGDCTAPYPTPEISFTIDISADTYDKMSKCSQNDYQRQKKFHDDHLPEELEKCGEQWAKCSWKNPKDPTKDKTGVNCKVRRKGYTTWEDMGKKPSYKVKFYDDAKEDKETYNFGTFDNVALSRDKFTLNNMKFSTSWSGHREVEAYDLYRAIGFESMPAAAHAEVTLKKGGEVVNTHSYALIEDANDGDYMKRMLPRYDKDRDGYMTFEADNRGLEYKKGKGIFDDVSTITADWTKLFGEIINRESNLLDRMVVTDIIRFYMGEVLTNNWDGACLRFIPNNYYITASHMNSTTFNMDKVKVRYIPKGMDRVFDGCGFHLMAYSDHPYCGPMQQVLNDPEHRALYENLRPEIEATAKRTGIESQTCADDLRIMSFMILASIACVVLSIAVGWFAVYLIRKFQCGEKMARLWKR